MSRYLYLALSAVFAFAVLVFPYWAAYYDLSDAPWWITLYFVVLVAAGVNLGHAVWKAID